MALIFRSRRHKCGTLRVLVPQKAAERRVGLADVSQQR